LEAACFDPASISRTSRRLGLISEASIRFERGVDPELASRAADRAAGGEQDPDKWPRITARPYQLLCVVCSLGEDPTGAKAGRLKPLIEQISSNPHTAITLRCNLREVFGFQTSGPDEDTPEGSEFNKKRDLDILYRLQVPPGITLPARILVNHLLDAIPTVRDICGSEGAGSEAWKGCPKADKGYYEQGRATQLALCERSCGMAYPTAHAKEKASGKKTVVLVPPRTVEDLSKAKKESLAAMYRAKKAGIPVKPHILLCAVCQYGGGARPPCPDDLYTLDSKAGYPCDNLPELLELVLKDPEARITLGEGVPWTVCAPCPGRDPVTEGCIHVLGHGGLTNQLRDLRMLRILGLRFGDTLNGRELYRLILRRIPSTLAVCRFPFGAQEDHLSVWTDGCGRSPVNNPSYEKGRKELMQRLGMS
ncbi:MAG: phenylalanine--tRNA ligase beta subunit-related protein, partial [Thermoguttaceae bacterium]|nr:phenylalanine--tRNA ligase beta subunit-related protein [Thermoguttaceae bacterium]